MLNVLAGILKGYGGTMLDLQGKEAQEEIERRRSRLSIISQAIPHITDPSLHAEAISLAEELATGKGKKKGGLAGFLSALTGGQAGDIGQGEKLKEFMARPREAMVTPSVTLPPVPGAAELPRTVWEPEEVPSAAPVQPAPPPGLPWIPPRYSGALEAILEARRPKRLAPWIPPRYRGPETGELGALEEIPVPESRVIEAPPALVPVASAFAPGQPPPGLATPVTLPGTYRTVRGPFPTPTEQIQQRAALTEAEARAGAGVKGEVATREAQRLEAEARSIGLTTPADIANYVRGHMVIPTATTAVAGTVPGTALAGRLPIDTLGNPIDPNQNYHVTRRPDGMVASAYPAAEVSRVAGAEIVRDSRSPTGWVQVERDWRSGQETGRRVVEQPAALTPTVTTTEGIRLVQQDNRWVPVPVTTTTTRGKAVPGAAGVTLPPLPTGGGARVGQPGAPVGERPIPATMQLIAKRATGAISAGRKLIDDIRAEQKAHPGRFGAVKGRLSEVLGDKLVALPREIQELRARMHSFAALQPAQHGYRATSAMRSFEELIDRFLVNPEMAIGGIEGIMEINQEFKDAILSGGAQNIEEAGQLLDAKPEAPPKSKAKSVIPPEPKW